MKKSIIKIKYFQPLILLFLGVVLLLLNRFSFVSSFKVPFSYVFEPVFVAAENVSNSLSNWGKALFSASLYIDEYEKLKEENIELASVKEQILNYEEYNALKESNSITVSEGNFVLSKVLGMNKGRDLYINTGTIDGVSEGDTVFVGNVFIGIVVDVNRSSSLVRLPANRTSTYEVIILPSDVEEVEGLDRYVKSHAVVTGGLDGIRIENIGINANVQDGDMVVIRDERIGDLFILGRVVSLSNNPAATSKSGFVSPIFDYANLLTVFVKVE